ncbi:MULTISPECIES: flagellin [Bacillus cereus group]|uniref:Flagellin n=1 Tax=Bacillus cereus MC67 TaxID=1053219 RepID=J8CCE3_BACCE|nr:MULTISPECIES: flagellin [Bacillus cereus group]EJR03834.1 hypothetical protein II3_00697 [Bacillus cereus MC67]EOP18523.1 flagellin [Bacillus cereus MC118]QWG27567.1 flagellin [Bacillus mycoides]
MNRLSSGKRINSAADDAAGLAIATRMRAKENGLGVASRNTQDGISLIRTADSALNSVSNILLRMRDLAVQSANGTNSTDDRTAINKEFGQLINQIDYIAKNTAFNGTTLLNGSTAADGTTHQKTSSVAIKTYDDGGAADISITLASANAVDLGLATEASGTLTPKNVNDANIITTIDTKLKDIATSRADLGATLNRLDFNVANLNSQASSMASSASQIEDADMAKEMSEMTKFKILNEAGISMLSQANQTPQMVSKLLQ